MAGAQGALPAVDDVLQEAKCHNVELLRVPTEGAIAILNGGGRPANVILHLTC